MLQIHQKNQSPQSLGQGNTNGDFDFFGEFHGITPKTPMYIFQHFHTNFVHLAILKKSDMTILV